MPVNTFIGTSGYAYKEWKGSFYPEKLPAKDMLRHYGEHFRAVEINASFYRLPIASTLTAWTTQVPAGFRFAMKAPQTITHFQRLKGSEESVAEFVKVAHTLGDRLGPLLFGLPPNMKKDAGRLRDVLAMLPAKRPRVAFEFRHPSWFDDEVLALLKQHKAALCIADADDELEVPKAATADFGYIRLRRAAYSPPALNKWGTWIAEQKWREAFVFFKHEDEGKGPRFAEKLLKAMEGKRER